MYLLGLLDYVNPHSQSFQIPSDLLDMCRSFPCLRIPIKPSLNRYKVLSASTSFSLLSLHTLKVFAKYQKTIQWRLMTAWRWCSASNETHERPFHIFSPSLGLTTFLCLRLLLGFVDSLRFEELSAHISKHAFSKFLFTYTFRESKDTKRSRSHGPLIWEPVSYKKWPKAYYATLMQEISWKTSSW